MFQEEDKEIMLEHIDGTCYSFQGLGRVILGSVAGIYKISFKTCALI